MITIKEQEVLEEHRKVFRKLAHFTAPAALEKNELPQAILDNLVVHALFLQKKPVHRYKIPALIKSQFKLNFAFDEIIVSLKRLLSKNIIIDCRGGFSLEVGQRIALQKVIDEKKIQEIEIFQKLEDHIKKQNPGLNKTSMEQIKSDFQLFLSNFFLLSGAEAVQLIYGNTESINDLLGKVRKKNIFELLPTREERITKIEQKEFCEFVNLLSEQEKIYLQDLLDRSMQYFTITVDKECEALLTADFAEWNLFIDTNFIYNLLGLNNTPGYRKRNTEKILELSRRANIKFFVSPVTLEEFSISASKAREILLSDKISRKFYKIAGDVTGDPILSSYYEVYSQQNITPKDFLTKTDSTKDVLKLYGINEKTDYSQSLNGTEEFDDIVKQLMELTGKEKNIAEHDAFHYLLILKLRKREGADNTFKTNKTWFLTYDGSLAPFDRSIRKSEIVFCIRPYQLRQILRPLFSRTDDFEQVFTDFVSEPIARAFPVVSPDIALGVLARITYYEKEFGIQNSLDVATKILTDRHFLDRLREFRTDEVELNKLVDKEIANQSIQVIEKKQDADAQGVVAIPKNYWNYFNPFWLLWSLLKWILGLVKRHKVGSIILVILGLLATDYALAWKNLKSILDCIQKIFGK